ncbi:MAG: DUF362 domain-containing protein [Candidatus Omnitrophota bacterium]|nr:DUF362 domain-containing protein [Candidatus Omnitrophota bacterium]
MKSKVSIVRCSSYQEGLVHESVRRAIDLIGGITNFIKPQSRVLVKPNLLMAKPPSAGIDTHPEIVRSVVKILKKIGCEVFVGDGPSVWGNQIENVDLVYEVSGVKQVCQDEGAALVKFEKKIWKKNFPFTSWVDTSDCIINLPKFKTHDFTLLTGAIKNLFGLIPGTYKTELHKNYFDPKDFSKILVDIYEEIRPCLTIVDGIVAMEGDGPATSGKLRNLNLLLASSDCVALDSILALIMGVAPLDILTNKEALGRNLGQAQLDSIEILGEELRDVMGEPFMLPSTSLIRKIPRPALKLAKKLIRYYPYLEAKNCLHCQACIEACPFQAISMKKEKINFNYSKCSACFCCQEACPAQAIKVKRNLFAKMIGL